MFLGANAQHDRGANHTTIWEEYLQLKRVLGMDSKFKGFDLCWSTDAKGKKSINWTYLYAVMAEARPISHWKSIYTIVQKLSQSASIEKKLTSHFAVFGEKSPILLGHLALKSFQALDDDDKNKVLENVISGRIKSISIYLFLFELTLNIGSFDDVCTTLPQRIEMKSALHHFYEKLPTSERCTKTKLNLCLVAVEKGTHNDCFAGKEALGTETPKFKGRLICG